MIHAIAPASCGELLQGWLMGGEKLVSYSIDCYSHVVLKEGEFKASKDKESPPYQAHRGIEKSTKAYRMLKRVLQYYGVQEMEVHNLHLEIKSEIPIGKGMASSTADLAATAIATATYLGKAITEEEIARLCVEIEPSDSIVFSEITLFDHLQGSYRKSYGHLPSCGVLLLEGKGRVDTLDFRKINREELLQRQETQLAKALTSFELGMARKDLKAIGEASMISSLANQSILFKDGLEEMTELGLKLGACGINAAHSGTVIGVLHDHHSFDQEKFIYEVKKRPFYSNYSNIKNYQVVRGGAKVL